MANRVSIVWALFFVVALLSGNAMAAYLNNTVCASTETCANCVKNRLGVKTITGESESQTNCAVL